jgi:hypothetical protein
MKWAIKERYFENGLVQVIGPYEVPDNTQEYEKVLHNHDVYLSIFDTEEEALQYKLDELTE